MSNIIMKSAIQGKKINSMAMTPPSQPCFLSVQRKSRGQIDNIGMQTTLTNENREGTASGIPVTVSESSLLLGKRSRSVDSGLFCLGGGSSSRVSWPLSQTRHNHKLLKMTPQQPQPVRPMPMHSQNNERFYSDSDYTYPEASCSGNEHEHETRKMIANSVVEASFQLQAHHHSLRIKQAKKERQQREDNEQQQQQEPPSTTQHDENTNGTEFRHAMSHACHALRRYEGTVETLDLTMMPRENTDGDNANFCEERNSLMDQWHSLQMCTMLVVAACCWIATTME
jgi:hypothetical protein